MEILTLKIHGDGKLKDIRKSNKKLIDKLEKTHSIHNIIFVFTRNGFVGVLIICVVHLLTISNYL